MKNMKVKAKLIVSFLIVVALAIVIGAVGIVGMSQLERADTELYESNLIAVRAMGNMNAATSALRMHLRTLLLYSPGDTQFQTAERAMDEIIKNVDTYLSNYQATIDPNDKDDLGTFAQIESLYRDVMIEQTIPNVRAAAETDDLLGAKMALEATANDIQQLDDLISQSASYNAGLAEASVQNNTKLFQRMTIIAVVVIAVALAVSIFLALYISGMISKPLGLMAKALEQMGTKGDLALDDEMQKSAAECAAWKDEVGTCARAVGGLIEHLTHVEEELQRVADGDLTVEVKTLSDRDNIGICVSKVVSSLNNMFGEINASTAQVAAGSKQIADGAQALAQGSTEQAAAVEQLSSSISEVAEKTKANAEMAEKAAALAAKIMGNAEKGSKQMGEMTTAVQEINQASQGINKVIKVIDDIAFQTNILALNAAVEAARAGQHGKGFAVVAEEVRNLAAKSAEAAKDTGGLIANSMEKAEFGARIAGETAASLAEIVSGINESSTLITEIARSSEEQASGISQINKGIDQVAQVVQQNSATAEESAAASEEMSGQSDTLEQLISHFKLKGGEMSSHQSLPSAGTSSQKRLSRSDNHSRTSNGKSGDYGKY